MQNSSDSNNGPLQQLFAIEMVDRVGKTELFLFPREIGAFEMFSLIREFMDDLVNVILIRLTQFGRHITVEYDSIRGTFTQISEKFGLVLFGTVMGCFEVGTCDIFAMVHTHHLFGSTRKQLFLDRHFTADEFE